MRNFLVSVLFIFILSSCILDEFKADELKMKEEWSMDIVSPLFRGDFEFKDLIHNWKDLTILPDEPSSILKYPAGESIEIPTRIIFEPTVLINNFALWVNGNYNFSTVNLKYTVSNGAPFPLNFQMRFFENSEGLNPGPPIIPPSFAEASFNGTEFTPVETVHILPLDDDQIQSLSSGEMVQFETWFNQSDLINSKDTFLSNYPITISVILYGEINAKL